MGRSHSACLLAIAGLAVGCGGGDPTGRTTLQVQGSVISSRSRAGIAGAEINIGGYLSNDFVTTTTGSDGSFAATVESFGCEGDIIFVTHSGYVQPAPFPDICSPRTVELNPDPLASVISPQDPTTGLGGTVMFQVRVTFVDGTVEDPGEAVWFIDPSGTIAGSECGSVSDEGVVRAVIYTAPSALPPPACGSGSDQVTVVAAPVSAGSTQILDASDRVEVTVTP